MLFVNNFLHETSFCRIDFVSQSFLDDTIRIVSFLVIFGFYYFIFSKFSQKPIALINFSVGKLRREKLYSHSRKNKILLRIYFTTTNFLLHWKIILIIFFLLFSMNFFFFLILFRNWRCKCVAKRWRWADMRTLFVDTFSEYRNTRDKVCTKLKKDDDDDEEKKKYSKLGLGSKHKLYHQTSNSTHNIKSNCRRVENFVRKKCQQIFKTFLTN